MIIEVQELDSPRYPPSETEPELITAVRGQVFAPGSASMVNVVNGGRRRGGAGPGNRSISSSNNHADGRNSPSVTAQSSFSTRTVKNVRSLPDLMGAAILLAQGGGRALAPSKSTCNRSHAGEILRSGSVRDTEPPARRPRKLVRKRTLREKESRDLLQVSSTQQTFI